MKPAEFVCPECHAALHIDRSKLPPGGARGRCPACKQLVLIPALAASRAAAAPASVPVSAIEDVATRRFNVADLDRPASLAEPPVAAETDTVRFKVGAIGAAADPGADDDGLATRRLSASHPVADDDEAIEIDDLGDDEPPALAPSTLSRTPFQASGPTVDAEASVRPAPRPAAPPSIELAGGSIPLARPQRTASATRSRPSVAAVPLPAPSRSGGAGRVAAGLLLGAFLGGGGGYLASVNGLLVPPPAPFALPGGEAVSWGALVAGVGALAGMLIGTLSRGRR